MDYIDNIIYLCNFGKKGNGIEPKNEKAKLKIANLGDR